MSDTIIITLDAEDYGRLVRGEAVVAAVAGRRIEVILEGVGVRGMIAAVLEAMGDDPLEAREFLPRGSGE